MKFSNTNLPASSLLALSFVLVLLSGCYTVALRPAFDPRFPDNDAETLGPIVGAAGGEVADAPGNSSGQPLIVASTHSLEAGERALVAFGLDGAEMWRTNLDVQTRPEVLGDITMVSTRENIVAVSTETGQTLWQKELDTLAYVGASRDGNTLLYVLSIGGSGGATRVGHAFAVDARSGRAIWDHELAGIFGRPVARGGYAMIPWDKQNIAILNLQTGNEVTRIRTTDDVLAWMREEPSGVYYGSNGIYRLDVSSATGRQSESTYVGNPVTGAPREPAIEDDVFIPTPGTRSARGRIRFYVAPAPGENGLALMSSRVYLVYYRYVFAYDATTGEMEWARILEQDVIRAQVLSGGLFTLGERGRANFLDASTGNSAWTGGAELELASAGFDVNGFAPESNPGEARDLSTSLLELAGDPDNRLVAARSYAIGQLAGMEDPEITRGLLDLYAQRSTPGALRDAIRESLRTREPGADYLVAALNTSYDYLDETRSPPFTLLVPALLEQEKSEALSQLIAHLFDHETPADQLALVLRAIVELGDESVVGPLQQFLTLYHADSTFAENMDPLTIAAEGIFRHGGDEGRASLQIFADRGRTIAPLKESITAIFQAETTRLENEEAARVEAEALAAAEAEAEERAARPERLTQEQINEVFMAQTDALRGCVEGEMERNPELGTVRFAFIIEQEGNTAEFRYAPNTPEFVECLSPTIAELRFPGIQQRRQRASFSIRLRSSTGNTPRSNQPAYAHWWSRAESLGNAAGFVGRPWWEVRHAAQPAQTQPAQPTQTQPAQTQPGQTQPAQTQPGQAQPGQTQPGEGNGGETGEPWWLQQNGEAAPSEGNTPSQPPADSGESTEGGEGEETPSQPAAPVDAWWEAS